ncbi:MAG: PEP-CTERM sorting domain-containing protein [Planctomycetes bacterium]|nr:PEP-CTERM sorting domain-containing protein [Planctomycetota bacterium]
MLPIADVTATFGALIGDYTYQVRVSDGVDFATASSSISLIPEPTSLLLASMGLIGVLTTRRRRS